jgi:hypothetical protein
VLLQLLLFAVGGLIMLSTGERMEEDSLIT